MADTQYAKVALAHHDDMGYDGGALSQCDSVSRNRKRNYKPVILRTASLLALLMFTLSLIGLLQYAVVRLPNVQERFGVDTLQSVEDMLSKREALSLSTEQPSNTESPSPNASTHRSAYVPTMTTQQAEPMYAYVPTDTARPVLTTESTAYIQTEVTLQSPTLGSSKHTTTPQADSTGSLVMGASPSDYRENPPSYHPPSRIYVPDQETKGAVVFRWTPSQVFLSTYLTIPARSKSTHSAVYFGPSANCIGPLAALLAGRYALFLTGVTFWGSCLLPALASEAIFVDTTWNCPDPKANSPNACLPRTTASVLIVRLLQSVLCLAAATITVLVFAIRGVTGIEDDPSSIAAVASLMGHPALEDDLQNLPYGPEATVALMKQELGQKKYRLAVWTNKSDNSCYGIVPDNDVEYVESNLARQSTTWSDLSAGYRPVDPRSSRFQEDPTPRRWRSSDLLLLVFVTGTFGTVLAYFLVSGDNGFNRFFNSSTFGPRFILTASATVIANIWGRVEQNSMVMAPFIRLSAESASFDTLTFAPTTTPILSTWRAVSNGYWFVGVMTIMTLLAEVLSAAISGVPFATGQTWLNFLVVSYISMAILAAMTLAAIAVIYHRKYEPNIPVVPETLGVKMSYLAGSNMLANFDANAGISGENKLRSGRYAFRYVTEKDGRRWWKVDQVGREGEDEYHAFGGSHSDA